MKDKMIQLLTNDFSITVNGITIFLDQWNQKIHSKCSQIGRNTTDTCNKDKKMTYIEIDEDQIAFRSEFDHNQTTFIIFSFNEINEMEIKINGNYHYF